VDQAAAHVSRPAEAGSGQPGVRIPVAREGWPFILPAAAAACILAITGQGRAAIPFAVAAGAFLGFFRDPDRTTPQMPGALVSPADGKVMAIAQVDDPWVGPAVRLSIFLSPLDVHVNRSPMTAAVRDVEYAHGRFLAAYRPDASDVNERCTVLLESDQWRVAVRQIAGVLARRIVCRVERGDKLEAGQRYGLIRFGSRTDLIAPRSADVWVAVGDHVRGGETIVAVLR
jgi:phosphatidylserine decarboxylase